MINIGLLSGGISGERYLSLESGEYIIKSLSSTGRYNIYRIDWIAPGQWVLFDNNGSEEYVAKSLPELISVIEKHGLHLDLLFDAFHGHEEADGHISAVLELVKSELGIPFVGNGMYTSFVGMDKMLTNGVFESVGLPVITSFLIQKPSDPIPESVLKTTGFPCIIKPISSGSSLGITLAHSQEELNKALAVAEEKDYPYIIQPFIKGKEYGVAVVGSEDNIKELAAVEIKYPGEFFDAACKEAGTYHMVRAELPEETLNQLYTLARKAHIIIQATTVTRTDFIIGQDGRIWILEINTHPGLSCHSIVPAQLEASGTSFADFIEELINKQLN